MKYDDIINLKRPISKHPKLDISSRAAQFAPFAALTGYDDEIKETARLTDKKLELSEYDLEKLNYNFLKINNIIKEKPKVKITYFIKDNKKSGGKELTIIENIKRIDLINSFIKLDNSTIINIDDIYKIELIEEEKGGK